MADQIGWGTAAAVIVVAAVLGFGLLDRFQQSGPTLSLWNAICRGLGITADIGPASEPQPPLRTPTRIAWTGATLDRIAAGNPKHGEFVAAQLHGLPRQSGNKPVWYLSHVGRDGRSSHL